MILYAKHSIDSTKKITKTSNPCKVAEYKNPHTKISSISINKPCEKEINETIPFNLNSQNNFDKEQ